MSFVAKDLNEFTWALASKAAVPGGGGAAALAGAIGAALASMVANLTGGKKKYAAYEADIQRIQTKAEALREELLRLIDGDAEAFEPLSRAYGIPKDDPARPRIMEEALALACTVPLDILRLSARAIELHAELADKGSALALSDVGVGAALCKAALQGASLNIFINTRAMTDRARAAALGAEAGALLTQYCALADETYAKAAARLR